MFTGFAGSVPVQLDVEVRGEITEQDVSIWELAALEGVFTDVAEDAVTYVNAPLLAKERGCEVRLITDEIARTSATSRRCAAPWPTAPRCRCRAR